MLLPWRVNEVRRLLAEGRSYRQVQRITGVSYVTVSRIAHKQRNGEFDGQEANEETDGPSGPAVRCPRCGHRLYLPCRICAAREAKIRGKTRPTQRVPPHEDDELRLSLRPHHQERYEEVRRWQLRTARGRKGVDPTGRDEKVTRSD